MRNILVKLADEFDRDGKHDLADAIDKILTTAGRPKAPLKGLKDDVKKSLILFLVDADKNIKSSTKGLNELFRRMRYFDIDDTIKDLGLDKVVKEMEKTQDCLDGAKKDFYAMTFGKSPSRADIEKLIEDLGIKEDDADDGQEALDFFAQHAEDDIPTLNYNSDEHEPEQKHEEDDDSITPEEYSEFFNSLYGEPDENVQEDVSFEDEPEDEEDVVSDESM